MTGWVKSNPNQMIAEAPRGWIQRHYSSFNGMRGLAIVMVFVNHYGPLVMPAKVAMIFWPGVDLFFVLSGFLITGILYDSRQSPSYFRGFYTRRALRIFPLYYGFFAVVIILRSPFHLIYQRIIWSNLLYISNLTRLNPDVSNPTIINFALHPHLQIGMGAFWSLCVEEQFYLMWPVVVWLTQSRTALMRICVVGSVCSLALRFFLFLTEPAQVARTHFLYFWTPTRCDGLLIGAWIALWLRGTRLTRGELRRIALGLIAFAVPVLSIGQVTVGRRWEFNEINPLLCTYGYTLIDLVAAAVLLLALDEQTRFAGLFRSKLLASLGTVSYGFYIIHSLYGPDFAELGRRSEHVHLSGMMLFLSAFFLTWSLAWLSFRYFESPLLRFKDRLAPPTAHRAEPVPAVGSLDS